MVYRLVPRHSFTPRFHMEADGETASLVAAPHHEEGVMSKVWFLPVVLMVIATAVVVGLGLYILAKKTDKLQSFVDVQSDGSKKLNKNFWLKLALPILGVAVLLSGLAYYKH